MVRIAEAADAARVYEEHQAWPAEVTDAVARHFLSALPKAPPRRCLFLGAATGANDALPFARVADPSDRILAGDIDPAFLDRLRERARGEGLGNVEARLLDIKADHAALGRFDLVTLLFVIHRVSSWERVVEPLVRFVAPGGSFFISEFAGPGGIIHLSNEGGGKGADPVSRLIRRYFELVPERFDPPLRSSRIQPVLLRLADRLRPMGHRDFLWEQTITPRGMLRKIERRVYAPYLGTRPSPDLLRQLREEFAPEEDAEVTCREIIRLHRFEAPPGQGLAPGPRSV